MSFEFATAARIVFGPGRIAELADLAAPLGRRPLLLTGTNPQRTAAYTDPLNAVVFPIAEEPTVALVNTALQAALDSRADMVIAIGGGSVIDTAKAVAALLSNPGPVENYLEVIGLGRPLTQPAAPCIACPTTAGTGAEVTRNAVLAAPEPAVKVSMRSPSMLPAVALVDPELTQSCPAEVTAAAGLDALTQLLEAFTTHLTNPLTDGICREGLRRVVTALPAAYRDGCNAAAREDMALASLFGGLALANAKLGAVHGFAGVLGARLHAAHGAVCAALLPHVVAANVTALQQRDPENPAWARYTEFAQLVTADSYARAPDAIGALVELGAKLHVKNLTQLGLQEGDIPAIVAQAQKASSMKGNPIGLTTDELTTILHHAAT